MSESEAGPPTLSLFRFWNMIHSKSCSGRDSDGYLCVGKPTMKVFRDVSVVLLCFLNRAQTMDRELSSAGNVHSFPVRDSHQLFETIERIVFQTTSMRTSWLNFFVLAMFRVLLKRRSVPSLSHLILVER